jgi:antitoxin component of MazEF toxin-antitoxin module
VIIIYELYGKMMQAKGKLLSWGNSIGIRLNKADLIGTGLDINDNVEVRIKKSYTKVKDIFGKLKKVVDTEKSLREIDEMFGEW